jgi:inorganic pyrophosphatase
MQSRTMIYQTTNPKNKSYLTNKVIVIDAKDPLAPKLNDIEDVEKYLPGLLRATNEWFRIYKVKPNLLTIDS